MCISCDRSALKMLLSQSVYEKVLLMILDVRTGDESAFDLYRTLHIMYIYGEEILR